jgi:hypothetical protein
MILSIDPGIDTGWALWLAGKLLACGYGDPRSHPAHRLHAEPNQDVVDAVWIEDQEIYPRSPVPPGDILTLAKLAHRVAGRYDATGTPVHFVLPRAWKGSTPCTCSARNPDPACCTHHSRVWSLLSDREKDVFDQVARGMAPSKRHNVLDAVGIGQWACRRQVWR